MDQLPEHIADHIEYLAANAVALRAWRRFVLRKLLARSWHYTGELLKAAKQHSLRG